MDNPSTKRSRGGRPTSEETMRKQMAATGVDPALVDPRRILAGIAADTGAPASARVAAAKALLAALPSKDGEPEQGLDELSRRALKLIARNERPN